MGVSMALSFVSILRNQPRGSTAGNSITSAALSRIRGYGPGSASTTGASAVNPVSSLAEQSSGVGGSLGVSTSVTSGQEFAAMNPRGRSATGMSSNHSGGTGFDPRSMRNSASTLNESHHSGLNSVRSISAASNVSISALQAATSINSHTSNPLPDYLPSGQASANSHGLHAATAQDALQENTTLNAGAPEEPAALPLTLCGVDLVIWGRVAKRSLILFLIGMFLANGWEYSTWRIPGVLQYFGVSYFVTGCTILSVHSLTKQRLAKLEREYGFIRHAHSAPEQSVWFKWESLFGKKTARYVALTAQAKLLTAYYYEWIIQAGILLIYLSLVFGARVAGCPRGYNGPGGISDNSENFDCTGGIHRYIDMKFFTWQLIYHHPTCLDMYQCRVYDPEGLLGSLSACTLTYLGLMAGRIVLHFPEHNKRMIAWCTGGCVLMFIAGVLCGFSREDGVIPINKNLWSTSFVAVTAGGGMVVLSLCYLLIDKWKVWSGAPFRYLGMNSIIIYAGHELLANYMPFSYKIYHVSHATLLQCNVLGTFAWVIIAAYFYHIKFFVKI
jgi:heparan-alpha-glucosaminide N-acetyltransferase